MRDLTHYFQLPTKEKDSGSQKENIEVLSENDEEAVIASNNEKVSKPNHSNKTSLSPKISKKESKEKNNSKVKTEKSKDKDDSGQNAVIVLNDNIPCESKTPTRTKNEKDSSESSKKSKKKDRLSLSSNKRKSDGSKRHVSVRKIPTSSDDYPSDVSSEKKSNVSDEQRSLTKNRDEQKLGGATNSRKSFQSSSEINGRPHSSSNCRMESSGKGNKDGSLKTPPQLNDNTNAFFVLMSSRAWKSPHSEDNKNGNESSSPDKKAKKPIVETPLKTAEMKENNRKRKQRLEDMSERKRIKKEKCNVILPEATVELTRLVIPESDSDGDGNGLFHVSMKSESDLKFIEKGKSVHAGCKSEKSYVETGETMVNTNKLRKNKNLNRALQKVQDSRYKANCMLVVEESDVEVSEGEKESKNEEKLKDCKAEEVKKNLHQCNARKTVRGRKILVIDSSDSESEKNLKEKEKKIPSQKLVNGSKKMIPRTRRKLIINSSESENEKPLKRKEMNRNRLARKKKKVKVKNNLSPKSEVGLINKTPVKELSKTKRDDNLVDESEKNLPKIKKDEQTTSKVDISDELENCKEKKIQDTVEKKSLAQNCKQNTPSSENTDNTKKRNSLFSYFNKVSKDESISKSEKIQVRAQIHSPPASPSSKRRSSRVSRIVVQKRQSSRGKLSDIEDQIIVLESNVLKSNETSSPNIGLRTPKSKCSKLKSPPSSGWRMRVKLRESSAESSSDADEENGYSSDNILI